MKFRSLSKYFLDALGHDTQNIDKYKVQVLERAYDKVFNSPEGELVIADLMELSGMGKVSYANEFKAETLAFIEGQRSVLHYIMQRIEMTELKFLTKKKAGSK